MFIFIAGVFVGAFISIMIFALCLANGRNNDQYEPLTFFEEKDVAQEQTNNEEAKK